MRAHAPPAVPALPQALLSLACMRGGAPPIPPKLWTAKKKLCSNSLWRSVPSPPKKRRPSQTPEGRRFFLTLLLFPMHLLFPPHVGGATRRRRHAARQRLPLHFDFFYFLLNCFPPPPPSPTMMCHLFRVPPCHHSRVLEYCCAVFLVCFITACRVLSRVSPLCTLVAPPLAPFLCCCFAYFCFCCCCCCCTRARALCCALLCAQTQRATLSVFGTPKQHTLLLATRARAPSQLFRSKKRGWRARTRPTPNASACASQTSSAFWRARLRACTQHIHKKMRGRGRSRAPP